MPSQGAGFLLLFFGKSQSAVILMLKVHGHGHTHTQTVHVF